MSAPQIPNLLSLRGRGGTRSRGSRGGRGGLSSPGASHDSMIQGTDTDASVSRLSAVDIGYLDDSFARYFVQNAAGPPTRRLPIINRGTYTRTTALDGLVSAFLSGHENSGEGEKRQIISLGAGTDTRPFRLLSQPGTRALIYHEIDFPAIAAKKQLIVRSVPVLRNITPPGEPPATDSGNTSWRSPSLPNDCSYFCHGLDLRDLAKSGPESSNPVILPGLQHDVPTLLISECCLCYLPPSEARSITAYFTSRIHPLSLILYEPIHPNDPFGKQMVANLAARRIQMPTLEVYKDVREQKARLEEAGFDGGVRGMTVQDVWRKWISHEEKERVHELEGLDEVEEWELLAGHYVIAWGWRGRGFEGWKSI
ncbi:S-adenosyl-L-methionine-dependent methyltransferase [Xylariales sp. AK1849]|nr:S-adenosyl-L-methionine-dependent methyltransferase [Xylariales sp. AK1849]